MLSESDTRYLAHAARLRGISLNEYVTQVAIAQARKDIEAAMEHPIVMTPCELSAFWNALNSPVALTEKQKNLARLMVK